MTDPLVRLRMLHVAIPKLSSRDALFAQSLLDGFRRYGKLSPKQWEWVDKLLANAQEAPKIAVIEIEGFSRVEAMLRQAAHNINAPTIKLWDKDHGKVAIRFHNGEVKLKWRVNDAPRWARIVHEGIAFNEKFPLPPSIIETVRKFAADPVEAAKRYGLEQKSCCFCGIGLTNASSRHHGYGPICADNFGLPWGDVPEQEFDAEGALNDLA